MKVYYCHQFVLPLPANHRFPMEKYRLLHERVEQTNGGRFELLVPAPASGADPFAGDRLGRLNLSKEGLAARDELVTEAG